MTQPQLIESMQQGQLQHGPPALARSSMCQSTTSVISHTATVGHSLGVSRPRGTPLEVRAGHEVTRAKGLVMAMALLQPLVCALVCLFACLSVVKLRMHSVRVVRSVTRQVFTRFAPTTLIRLMMLSFLMSCWLLCQESKMTPCGMMVEMLKLLKPSGFCTDSWRQNAWHDSTLPFQICYCVTLLCNVLRQNCTLCALLYTAFHQPTVDST